MMFEIGATVRVLPPFSESFPDEYVITEIAHGEDGSTAYILGENGGFDARYLEAA